MPSFDGGHYFLTALIPVRMEPVESTTTSGSVTSHLHALREVLASLPTALQSPATEQIGVNSPFAHDARTHFARLFVVDDLAFNGRNPRNPIKVAVLGPPPSQFDPVDRLCGAYLVYVTDFDAPDGEAATVEAYLRGLWAVMEPEWRGMLQHCHGYGRVSDAAGFAKLIRACQVETTMPFNDYWEGGPPLQPLPLKPFVYSAIGGAALLLLGLLMAIFADGGWLWLALIGLLVLVGTVAWAFMRVTSEGSKPFPMAPRSDLPGVLKAVYLQQRFTRFAIDAQGTDAATLHARFGTFLAQHKPGDVAAPTQPRGVVRS